VYHACLLRAAISCGPARGHSSRPLRDGRVANPVDEAIPQAAILLLYEALMNREWVLFHLQEAQEELRRTIAEIASTPDYGSGEFVVAITHAYHHLNTAWNSRDQDSEVVAACKETDVFAWRQFPSDIYLGA
jgi:hypothetical protein